MLAQVSLFEALRADEVGRIARRFELARCEPGSRHAFAARPQDGRFVVVVDGAVHIEVESGAGALRGTMYGGNRFGVLSLLTGHARPFSLEASAEGATIATIDSAAFEAVLSEFPAVSLPVAAELSSELAAWNDLVRQMLELHAERLRRRADGSGRRTPDALRRGARVSRLGARALPPARRAGRSEPPFWMLVGFLASLGWARLVVHLILKYKLEKQLFALVPGTDPNPMHVHHFNYGLLLIGAAGSQRCSRSGRGASRAGARVRLRLRPRVRRVRALLEPEPRVRAGASLFAAGDAAARCLVQLAWFREYWKALAPAARGCARRGSMSAASDPRSVANSGEVDYRALPGRRGTLAELDGRRAASRRTRRASASCASSTRARTCSVVPRAATQRISVDHAGQGRSRCSGPSSTGRAFGEMASLTA